MLKEFVGTVEVEAEGLLGVLTGNESRNCSIISGISFCSQAKRVGAEQRILREGLPGLANSFIRRRVHSRQSTANEGGRGEKALEIGPMEGNNVFPFDMTPIPVEFYALFS